MKKFDDVKTSKIQTVIGLSFILLGIIFLINVGYIVQSLVMAITFVFGFFAYWFMFPSMIIFGLFLIITRNKEFKFKINYIVIGLGLLVFAMLVLVTLIPFEQKDLAFTNFNNVFLENYLKAIPTHEATNYHRFNPMYYQLGGGWLGFFFASLMSYLGKAWAITVSSLVIVGALFLIFHKNLIKLVDKIKAKREINKDLATNTTEVEEKPDEDIITPITDQEVKDALDKPDVSSDPSELVKANLYSNNDAPDTAYLTKSNDGEEQLQEATMFNDESAITKDMPKLDEKLLKPYVLPSLDLLKTYEVGDIVAKNEESCAEKANIINLTFQSLRIGAKVVGHTIGPRVTRFDIQVDANASLQSIPKYVTDISQRLGGVNARFEPIVTGKTTSGLEVANKESSIIGFKEIVAALPSASKSPLMIPFGKNITGEIKYADLAKFPHLLIGGATGSGKSVFVHSLIMTLIMRNTPKEVRLLLVDPKHVEFTHYKNSPFLLCPVVSDPKKAKVALEKLVEEMERRYCLFEGSLTNNIITYNNKVKANGGEPLPYIVTIVDEFADLIQQNKKIDLDIARITAKARAAGIHLVIATQRPSVDVITGVIKSNLPVRVALSVPDIESSKTIIGGMGAEQLLGNGDMLVSCPLIQANGNVRVQGCYVTEEEVDKVVSFINSQREPQYDPRFMDLEDHTVEPVKGDEVKISAAEARKLRDDDLYNFVKEQVYKREYTSISVIERENGIGFTRAGRLFKRLQDEGLVSLESEASKGSKVLKENFHFEEKEQKIGSEELTDTEPNQ